MQPTNQVLAFIIAASKSSPRLISSSSLLSLFSLMADQVSQNNRMMLSVKQKAIGESVKHKPIGEDGGTLSRNGSLVPEGLLFL